MSKLVNIDGIYYLPSDLVKVFPTAYRGIKSGTTNSHINIESKLSTENSLRHLSPSFTKDGYISSWEQDSTTGTLCCYIAGYYFELKINEADITIDNTKYDTLCLYLDQVNLSANSASQEKTTRLMSWHSVVDSENNTRHYDNSLDFKYSDNNYYFTGLCFLPTSSRSVKSNAHHLDLAKNTNPLAIDYTKIESKHTDEHIGGSIYDGTNTNSLRLNDPANTASGAYSLAEGEGTNAKLEAQHVFGKYNNDASNTVEIVGWGTSAARKNIRTLSTDGDEWLSGNIVTEKTITAKHAATDSPGPYGFIAEKDSLTYGGFTIKNLSYTLGNTATRTSETASSTRGLGSYYFKDSTGNWIGFTEARLTNLKKPSETATIPTTNLHLGIKQCHVDAESSEVEAIASYFDLYANDSTRWATIDTVDFTPTNNEGTNLGAEAKQWNKTYSKNVLIQNTADVSKSNEWKNAPFAIYNDTDKMSLEMDCNEIMAKKIENGEIKVGSLALQADGGSVTFGNNNTDNNNKTIINSGDITTNNIKLTGKVQSNLIPSGTIALGSSNNKWNEAYITTVHGALDGNANTATTLQTARNINGSSFDGSDNITTSKWGTTRAIGIVNSDGSGTAVTVDVNGSAAINLKLPATIKASLNGNASSATNVTTNINGKAITTIFESNGTTVKNATVSEKLKLGSTNYSIELVTSAPSNPSANTLYFIY